MSAGLRTRRDPRARSSVFHHVLAGYVFNFQDNDLIPAVFREVSSENPPLKLYGLILIELVKKIIPTIEVYLLVKPDTRLRLCQRCRGGHLQFGLYLPFYYTRVRVKAVLYILI